MVGSHRRDDRSLGGHHEVIGRGVREPCAWSAGKRWGNSEGPGEGRVSGRGAAGPGLLTSVCLGSSPSRKKEEKEKEGKKRVQRVGV